MIQTAGAPPDSCEAFTKEAFFDFDWGGTPLGPVSTWPLELRHAVEWMLDTAQPMFLVWGDERLLLFNSAFCGILGSRFMDAMAAPVPEIWSAVWDEIRGYVDGAFAGRSRLVENVPLRTWASDFRETCHFTFAYSPLRATDGRVVAAVCIATDTTDAWKASQRVREDRDRLQSGFDQAPVFLALGSADDLRFTYANKAYQALVCREEVVGKTVAEILPEAVAQGFLAILRRVRETGEPFVGHDMPYVRPTPEGDEERFIDFIYQPVLGADGRVESLLCVGSDVTEEHRAREQAAELQRRLEQTARVTAMGNMAATLAHELNQPLAAAANYLSGGRRAAERLDGADAETVRTALDAAAEQVRRGGDIIRKARSAVSNRDPVVAPVNLLQLVERTVISARASRDVGPRVEVRLDIDPAIEARIDAVQIEQVFINLLRNACAAMAGTGAITICAERAGPNVEIGVRDTGPGIQASVLTTLFSPFVRSSSGGLGVGLSLARTIVEAQNGHIRAVNNPEGGATFWVRLPASEAAQRTFAAAAEA